MAICYRTRINKNGNIYSLTIYSDKSFCCGWNRKSFADVVLDNISKRKIRELKNTCRYYNYKEI